MAEISSEIRLAVDSGETAIGVRDVIRSIRSDRAKLIIIASKNKEANRTNVEHIAKVSGIRTYEYGGTPADLGTLCGKPFSVSMLSIIDAGNSRILEGQGE